MPKPEHDPDNLHREQESRIQRQVAFASGLFQGDVTIRTLLESLAEGVVIIDSQGTILLVNARAEEMFGYSKRELVGIPHSVLLPERLREIHEGHVAHFFVEPTVRPMGQLLDLVGRRKDGDELPVEISLSFLETINGCLALAFISDISHRKEAEKEIKALNAQLSARAAELECANSELEAFNAAVSHDLKTPLSNINAICQALQELHADRLDEEGQDLISDLHSSTLRMSELINTFLGFARLSHCTLVRQTVGLSHMAKKIATELGMAEPTRRVTFRIADGLACDGEPALLRIVLDNLLGNAWKYSSRRDDAVIEFGITEHDGKPAYFVRDNGEGFDMARAERLFAPFHRLPDQAEFTGHGIGLATVQRIVSRHCGRVWAESEPGMGATFYFTLNAD